LCRRALEKSKGIEVDATPQASTHSSGTPTVSGDIKNASNPSSSCFALPIPHPTTLTHPIDFFKTRQIHECKAHGQAMQMLQDSRFIDAIPPGTQAIERAHKLSEAVMKWATGWGGVAVWHITLNRSYTEAFEEGRVNQWQEQMLGHAAMGRRLLSQYTNLSGELPSEPYKIKELWRISIEMMEMLVTGITLINSHCLVLPHGWQVKLMPLPAWSDDCESESSNLGDAADDEDFDSSDDEM
jgi:hypothetical protein